MQQAAAVPQKLTPDRQLPRIICRNVEVLRDNRCDHCSEQSIPLLRLPCHELLIGNDPTDNFAKVVKSGTPFDHRYKILKQKIASFEECTWRDRRGSPFRVYPVKCKWLLNKPETTTSTMLASTTHNRAPAPSWARIPQFVRGQSDETWSTSGRKNCSRSRYRSS